MTCNLQEEFYSVLRSEHPRDVSVALVNKGGAVTDHWPDGVPDSAEALAAHLRRLRSKRKAAKDQNRRPRSRSNLSRKVRESILAKTDRRCHICGGVVEETWHADHVLAHSSGGAGEAANYLPAHSLCNNYRWDYLPEEFQAILKIGVWARTEIEHGTALGTAIGDAFLRRDRARHKRRRPAKGSRAPSE
jgi:hypothetical protein